MEQAKCKIRFFVHTEKASKRGCPVERLYVVVEECDGDLMAWKTEITDKGIEHPKTGYRQAHTVKEIIELSKTWEEGGSMPTAQFTPDSLYKELTEQEVENLF